MAPCPLNTPLVSHPEPAVLFVCDKAVRQLQQIRNIKNLRTTSVNLDILFVITKKICINSFTKRSANRIVTRKVC